MAGKSAFETFEASIADALDALADGITPERPDSIEAARRLANVGGALSFFFGPSRVWHCGDDGGRTTEYSEQDRERRAALYSRAARALVEPPSEEVKAALGADLEGFEKARDYVLGIHLRFLRVGFDETASPAFAWQSYLCCREAHRPVEDWVLAYLDGCAAGLVILARTPPNDIRKAVTEAVGFGSGRGRGNPLTDAQRLERDIEIYKRVRERLDLGDKRTIAWETVADAMALSPSKVRQTHLILATKFGDSPSPG